MHATCREGWHHRFIVLFLQHFFVFAFDDTDDERFRSPAGTRYARSLHALREYVRVRQHDAPVRVLVRALARAAALRRDRLGFRVPVPGLLCR
jgi:hypothetical protein